MKNLYGLSRADSYHVLTVSQNHECPILMQKSSKSPGCIRAFPASQSCQVRSVEYINAAAADCESPASNRAWRISSGAGLDVIIDFCGIDSGLHFGLRKRQHRAGIESDVHASSLNIDKCPGHSVFGDKAKRLSSGWEMVCIKPPITAEIDGKAAAVVMVHGRALLVILLVGWGVVAVGDTLDLVAGFATGRGAQDSVMFADVAFFAQVGGGWLGRLNILSDIFVRDDFAAFCIGHQFIDHSQNLCGHRVDLTIGSCGVVDRFNFAIRAADRNHAVAGDGDHVAHFVSPTPDSARCQLRVCAFLDLYSTRIPRNCNNYFASNENNFLRAA